MIGCPGEQNFTRAGFSSVGKGVGPGRDRNAGIDIRSRRTRRPQEEGGDEALEVASDLQRRSFMFRYRN
jgi:hypothetical protein